MEGHDKLASKIFNEAVEGLLIIHRVARDNNVSPFLRADDDRLVVGPFNDISEKMPARFREQLLRLGFQSPEPESHFNAWLYDTSVDRRGDKDDN
jgi:hypothetical protein